MKRLLARSVRPVFGIVRRLWRLMPAPARRWARPMTRRLRGRLLGAAVRAEAGASSAQLKSFHPHVRLELPGPKTLPAPRPVTAPQPIVSVVITAHDDGAFIGMALDSVRRQDLSEWECIVVDDASLDDTVAVVLRHAEEDPRIRLIRRSSNVGLASARNTGIAAAVGEFVAFLDADDFLVPNTLGARVRAARSDNPAVAGSWCDWASVREDAGLESAASQPGRFATKNYLTGGGENQIISTSPLVRRDVLRSLDGYDDSFRTAEDFEYATRLFRNGFHLEYAPLVGVAYRQKRASMISGDPLGHARNAMRVYDYMARPLSEAAISPLAIDPHIDPPLGIPSDVKRLERLVAFLTFAVIGGDPDQIEGIRRLLPPGLLGPSTCFVDVDGRIDAAIRRHSTRDPGFDRHRRDVVEATVRSIVAGRGLETGEADAIELHSGRVDTGRLRHLRQDDAAIRPVAGMGPARPWDVLLVGGSVDAANELLLVGRELVEEGLSVAMLDLDDEDARRRMTFEGIYRVAPPIAPVRLLVTSSGQPVDVEAGAHLVISCESQPLLGATEADTVHVRGQWELPGSDEVRSRVVGSASRWQRAAATGQSGSTQHGRGRTVLVTGSPVDGFDHRALDDIFDPDDLVWVPALGAERGRTVDDAAVAGLMPFLRAVVAIGSAARTADALVFGTPVYRVAEDRCPGDTWAGELAAFPDALGAVDGGPRAVESPQSEDPLAGHLQQIHEMLGR